MTVRILKGDCREVLRTLEDESVHCVVTSPPYFGLRDYGVDGQIGLETTPDQFVLEMVSVFREVRRVMRADGTAWLNLGDSYTPVNYGPNAKRRQDSPNSEKTLQGQAGHWAADIGGLRSHELHKGCRSVGLKSKDLIGIPWRVAFALQADGWYLRQDIIWSKPNPMPESVKDRCTKAHEYIFLLSKSERYHYDARAIAEPAKFPEGPGNMESSKYVTASAGDPKHRTKAGLAKIGASEIRNKRSVWEVTTIAFSEAHFATFPPTLIEPCILAGCPEGGTVMDPFGGAGTTGLVADRLKRNAILIELNPEYAAMAEKRIHSDAPLFADVAAE